MGMARQGGHRERRGGGQKEGEKKGQEVLGFHRWICGHA